MAKVKSWTSGEVGEPTYPDDFEVVRKAVLQNTDIKTNRNKYYALELHEAMVGGKPSYRVFTHYGRTDDLETNPDAGAKECRYFDAKWEAEASYEAIYRQKTAASKGYKEIALASSRIGSARARGTNTGEVDSRTLERLNQGRHECGAGDGDGQGKGATKPTPPPASKLKPAVQDLIRTIYDEAKGALTSTVSARITAHGIETPLGILTLGQIEKGEAILSDLYAIFQDQQANHRDDDLARLSGDFYTAIPHRIGRTRVAVGASIIDSLAAFEAKQTTLQLMKDMLQVNGEAGSVLFDARADQEYQALNCHVEALEPGSSEAKEITAYLLDSQVRSKRIRVKALFRIKRDAEHAAFAGEIDNQRLLFHGSRIQNWVGILTRGILLPKIVVSMGVHRTDAGWLGHGIYFGDAACTSMAYATPSQARKTSYMAIARVALGKIKDYHQITYGLSGPPSGYQSCHGVRARDGIRSQFADDEYVVYDVRQQRLEYLAEVAA